MENENVVAMKKENPIKAKVEAMKAKIAQKKAEEAKDPEKAEKAAKRKAKAKKIAVATVGIIGGLATGVYLYGKKQAETENDEIPFYDGDDEMESTEDVPEEVEE